MRKRVTIARLALLLSTVVVALAAPSLAEARITRIEINRIESPTFDGTSFGTVGQYEKLVGRAYGEVDPSDPKNAIIATSLWHRRTPPAWPSTPRTSTS